MKREIKAIAGIRKKMKSNDGSAAPGAHRGLPKIKDFGKILHVQDVQCEAQLTEADLTRARPLSYMIVPRYGMTLEKYFKRNSFSKETVYSLGMQLLDILEQIHAAGYVYNDLKLDNLMLDYGFNPCANDSHNVFLDKHVNFIDFGFATRYVSKETGKHVEPTEVPIFQGNIVFSSVNQLNFKTTSRRDDLISLFYLLVYLLQEGQVSAFEINTKATLESELERVK